MISRVPRLARLLIACRRGVTLVEFALLAPALLVMVMGLFDLGYTMYINAMLNGSIQKAARDSTIEGADGLSSAMDLKVSKAVKAVVYRSTLEYDRKSYARFSDVRRPEDYTDVDGDGTCSKGEPFEDANGNGHWDRDRGIAGQGGARDTVLYTVRVTYARPFPIGALIGQKSTYTLESKTVLRNQPYGMQRQDPPAMGNCL